MQKFVHNHAPHLLQLGLLLLTLSIPARAEVDFGGVSTFTSSADNSPIPKGLVVGGALVTYNARYQAQDNTTLAFPGFIYFGEQLFFQGDRARYYFGKSDNFAPFLYGRFRPGNLDPDDEAAFAGMNKRKWELEGGIGASLRLPGALITTRVSGDMTGTSKGQEAMLWADFPIIRGPLMLMPGAGVMWRSSKLANYYFGGVSAAEATLTRPQYDTGSTLSPMASLVTSYRFNKQWLATAILTVEHYDKNIAMGPLVQHSNEVTFVGGVGYTWK
jgi:outer membrane protein